MCLAEAFETYHHWRVFSNSSGGVCIEFDKDKLIAEVADVPGLRAETVQYRTIKALREQPVAESDLPFLKRHAFRDEKEFRLFVGRKTRDTPLLRVPVDRSAVRRVTLSPGCRRRSAIRSEVAQDHRGLRQAARVPFLAGGKRGMETPGAAR